jgi:Leucine-rich repeat (LRR) protein
VRGRRARTPGEGEGESGPTAVDVTAGPIVRCPELPQKIVPAMIDRGVENGDTAEMNEVAKPERCTLQFGLRKALLWMTFLAVLLAAFQMMGFWTADFAIGLGGIAILSVVRSLFRPRHALALWMFLVAIAGVAVSFRTVAGLAHYYRLSQHEILLNMIWLSVWGLILGSVTGFITYKIADLTCYLVDRLDRHRQWGDASTNESLKRRKWLQFNLRTMLVAFLVLGVPLSWFSARMDRARRQRNAVEELGLGAFVRYESDRNAGVRRAIPSWLWELLGRDFFDRVVEVSLVGNCPETALNRIEGLTNLECLKLRDCQVADAGLVHVGRLVNLKELELVNTSVTDNGLEHLKGLDSLQTLDLGTFNGVENRVTDVGLEHIRGLTNLTKLNLNNAQVTDAGLEHLAGLARLRELYLSGTEITDIGLDHLNGLTDLGWLYLGGTEITDAGLERLAGLTNLRSLLLNSTEISDAGLEHLEGLTRLDQLYLDDTQVSDAGLEHLKGLSNLFLRRTQVTAKGVERLQEVLPNCRIQY